MNQPEAGFLLPSLGSKRAHMPRCPLYVGFALSRVLFTSFFLAPAHSDHREDKGLVAIPMALLPKPGKPLKILTIDGGGLQAISNLLILDKLLDTIASNNQAKVKPRPCDIFDTIAG